MTNIPSLNYIGREVPLTEVFKDLGIEATTPYTCHCGREVIDIEERLFFEQTGECLACDHVRGDLIGSESEGL